MNPPPQPLTHEFSPPPPPARIPCKRSYTVLGYAFSVVLMNIPFMIMLHTCTLDGYREPACEDIPILGYALGKSPSEGIPTEACRTTHNLLPSAASHLQPRLGTAPNKVKTGSSIHRLCAAWVCIGMPLSLIHMSVCSMGMYGYASLTAEEMNTLTVLHTLDGYPPWL